MIEVDIPSVDPIQHEPRLILGLTLRQAVCLIVGGGLGAAAYFLLESFIHNPQVSAMGLVIFLLPACCLGWYKPFNMKCEDYVKLIYYNNFVCYPTRILKTDGAEDIKLPTMKERQAMEKRLQANKKARRNNADPSQRSKGGLS